MAGPMHAGNETPAIDPAAAREREMGEPRARLARTAAVSLGALVTLTMHGYQFGESNHTVYLLDAMRRASPELLANDWFTTQTLQYHAIFGWLTSNLVRLGILQTAFGLGYLSLVLLLHIGWLRLVRAAGGALATYLVSVVLFHISAAGTGLGMYQFLQDGSFLPSNIANVAMLWGVVLWVERRWAWAGIAFGVAGLFHLNHAVVGTGLWGAMSAWSFRSIGVPPVRHGRDARAATGFLLGTVVLVLLCGGNIVFAARAMTGAGDAMPLGEFVDLYVRLRHPHHYDPSAWPAWLFVAFAWPLPFALALAGSRDSSRGELWRFFLLFVGILVVALLGAGLFYWNERLVQMSLYRFSIYPKLIACVAAAMLVAERRVAKRQAAHLIGWSAVASCVAMVVACLVRGPYLGLFRIPGDDVAYLDVADWARQSTPADAVFLVPPDEQGFRLHARRAIVVNFKGVPQLGGELPEWRDRLAAVLDLPSNLRPLPRGNFERTLAAIRARYASLPAEHLTQVAARYGARYVVVIDRPLPGRDPVYQRGPYLLYDLAR